MWANDKLLAPKKMKILENLSLCKWIKNLNYKFSAKVQQQKLKGQTGLRFMCLFFETTYSPSHNANASRVETIHEPKLLIASNWIVEAITQDFNDWGKYYQGICETSM